MTWLIATPFSVVQLIELRLDGCSFFLSAREASRTRSVGVAQVSAITEKQDARVHIQHQRAQRLLSIPVQAVDGTDGAVSLQRDAHFGHFAFGLDYRWRSGRIAPQAPL